MTEEMTTVEIPTSVWNEMLTAKTHYDACREAELRAVIAELAARLIHAKAHVQNSMTNPRNNDGWYASGQHLLEAIDAALARARELQTTNERETQQ